MHNSSDILTQIIKKRKSDIEKLGLDFGFELPVERKRKVHPFLKSKGVILEVKRASPSKGDICPELDAYSTALSYIQSGARAISCLTESNYFKGSLNDLMQVCRATDDFKKQSVAVLRKDFLLYPEEVEISYRAGADAVLLIARILSSETLLKMAREVVRLGMSALIEIRSDDDLEKLSYISSKVMLKNFVFGINSRDLATFKIDLLKPCMMVNKIKSIIKKDARIIFESGVTNCECASVIGSMGFSGLLLGEAAAKNPGSRSSLVKSFTKSRKTENAVFWKNYAEACVNLSQNKKHAMIKICGLTREKDILLSDKLGADFTGFIFADAFPRSITHENRLKNILSCLKKINAKRIAVIVDLDSDESKLALKLVKNKVFDAVQFHKIPYKKVSRELLSLPHYFATDSIEEYERLVSNGEMRVLLDSKKILETGSAYKQTDALYEIKWTAGGINQKNIFDVIKRFSPELIDVSGGIELENETGIKDENKMKELFIKLSLAAGSDS